MIYMMCYDISDPKRLAKTAKTLENYGIRVQKSFFQCEMRKSMMEGLKQDILKIINVEQDFFFVYPLCDDCTRKAVKIGKGEIIKLEAYEII